jgi:hypothetical protein
MTRAQHSACTCTHATDPIVVVCTAPSDLSSRMYSRVTLADATLTRTSAGDRSWTCVTATAPSHTPRQRGRHEGRRQTRRDHAYHSTAAPSQLSTSAC